MLPLSVFMCIVLAMFSAATIYLACSRSYTRTLRLQKSVHSAHVEDYAFILWVLPVGADKLSSTDVRQIRYYTSALSAMGCPHKFAALARSCSNDCRKKLSESASALHVVKGDTHKLAAAKLKREDDDWMSWLLLLPSLRAIANQKHCSHLGLLKLNSPIYSNLQRMNCSAAADLFQVPGLGHGDVAAVGFDKDKVDYLVSMLADMVHIPDLKKRFDRLWHLFVHCTTSPNVQIINESSSDSRNHASHLAST